MLGKIVYKIKSFKLNVSSYLSNIIINTYLYIVITSRIYLESLVIIANIMFEGSTITKYFTLKHILLFLLKLTLFIICFFVVLELLTNFHEWFDFILGDNGSSSGSGSQGGPSGAGPSSGGSPNSGPGGSPNPGQGGGPNPGQGQQAFPDPITHRKRNEWDIGRPWDPSFGRASCPWGQKGTGGPSDYVQRFPYSYNGDKVHFFDPRIPFDFNLMYQFYTPGAGSFPKDAAPAPKELIDTADQVMDRFNDAIRGFKQSVRYDNSSKFGPTGLNEQGETVLTNPADLEKVRLSNLCFDKATDAYTEAHDLIPNGFTRFSTKNADRMFMCKLEADRWYVGTGRIIGR